MKAFRRGAYVVLALAYLQIVFGAIVRITGSGLGCGDHWPDCYGSFTPAHRGLGLLIEISHRYGAAALTIGVFSLAFFAFFNRRDDELAASGVQRTSIIACGLVILAALMGAVTVKVGLNPLVVVTHLAIAMSLLATLVVTVILAGGFGALANANAVSEKTWRVARIAVVLTAITLIMGALTANVASAASSCGGFPWCRTVTAIGTPLWIQVIHRVIAFLLLGHLAGAAIAIQKRNEPRRVVLAARAALGAAILQVLVAAAMVELHLPPSLRSLHQATGTLVWLAVCVFASLARAAQPVRVERAGAFAAEAA